MEYEAFFMMLGFVFFVYWIIKELKKEKLELNTKYLIWFFFAAIFGALAGGRLWYYIENWQGLGTIITMFNLSQAGLTSYGMIIGGVLSIILFTHNYNKKNKIEKSWGTLFTKYTDIVAVATALFIFIYRMGCFHYGDVPGTATRLPWGMFAIHYGNFTGMIMHPAALYLSFSALLIFLFLNWYQKRKKFNGEIGILFVIIYSFNRFCIEFLIISNNMGISKIRWIILIIMIIFLHELWIRYFLIKKLNLKSLKKYSDFYKEISWLKLHKIYFDKIRH